jgi:CRP/FNR family cyclic AMP-dependent transcriptional regulator
MTGADLKKYRLLAEMDDESLDIFAGFLSARRFKNGALIFVENMVGESLFFIEKGQVSLTKMVSEGVEEQLMLLGPGESFGESAIIDEGRRVVTARVEREAEIFVLSREEFGRLSGERPDIALQFVTSLIKQTLRLVRDNVPFMVRSLTEGN